MSNSLSLGVSNRFRRGRIGWRSGFFWALAAALVVLGEGGESSGNELKNTSSLGFVPSNVGIYDNFQGGGELVRDLMNSRAFAKIQELPGVQLGWNQIVSAYKDENHGALRPLREWYEQAENSELVAMLLDGFSTETFMYADSHWVDLWVLAQQIRQVKQFGRVLNTDRQSSEEFTEKALVFLAENRARLRVEPFVLGMKVRDVARAKGQISRLETFLRKTLPEGEFSKDHLVREAVGGGDYLTLKLEGSLVPWSSFPLDRFGESEAKIKSLFQHLAKQTLSISVGTREGYLLFSLGPNSIHLANLGKGKLLIDMPELAILSEHADKRVVGIKYVSPEYSELVEAAQEAQVQSFVDVLETMMKDAHVEEDVLEEFQEDSQSALEELKDSRRGGLTQLSIQFRTPRGLETFSYLIGDEPLDSEASPLPIRAHLGGNPILALVGRSPMTIDDYEATAELAEQVYYYFGKLAMSNLDEDAQKTYHRVEEALTPILEQFDETVRASIVPALADGQMALVFDAKEKSRQLHPALPLSKSNLPAPEFAVVMGISDSKACEEGVVAIYNLIQKAADILHKELPDDVPAFKLASPKQEPTEQGKLAIFPLPAMLEVDAKIAPTGGLGKNYAVLSTSPAQCRRVLEERPFKLEGALAASPEELISLSHFNMAALVDMVEPWTHYAIVNADHIFENATGDFAAKTVILAHVKAGMEVARCFRSVTSVSYVNKGRIESHTEFHFEDLN